jgi:hypothetical protein|tara:strand:+ start:338 stop:700 length:363 start_codon:yes stop_codon:yes gene_type:complete
MSTQIAKSISFYLKVYPKSGLWVNVWISSSAGDHSAALEPQKFDETLTQDESSKVPALMNLMPELSSTKLITGEPQSLQNPLLMCEPAVPVTIKNFKLPSTLRAASGTITIVALPLPVDF